MTKDFDLGEPSTAECPQKIIVSVSFRLPAQEPEVRIPNEIFTVERHKFGQRVTIMRLHVTQETSLPTEPCLRSMHFATGYFVADFVHQRLDPDLDFWNVFHCFSLTSAATRSC